MKEKSVERWMVDKDGDVIDVRSGQMMACLVDVSVPTRRGQLIAAAPAMYELMCAAVRFLQTASQYHPLTVTEEKWEMKALELMSKIEGGGE